MKQCKICINKPYKDKLLCCAGAELNNAFNDILKKIPFIRRFVKPFECGSRIVDKRYTGFPDDSPVYCRCSINFEINENKE